MTSTPRWKSSVGIHIEGGFGLDVANCNSNLIGQCQRRPSRLQRRRNTCCGRDEELAPNRAPRFVREAESANPVHIKRFAIPDDCSVRPQDRQLAADAATTNNTSARAIFVFPREFRGVEINADDSSRAGRPPQGLITGDELPNPLAPCLE